MKPPRGLSREETALWRKVAATVTPLRPPRHDDWDHPQDGGEAPSANPAIATKAPSRPSRHPRPMPSAPPSRMVEDGGSLDASWDRRLGAGLVSPDFTLDLHGHTLDQAHRRLDAGLAQAKAMGARLVLLIAGKARPAESADRGSRRGAIRAKVLDWLAAGPHAADIAAIRKAHRRHGGDGALYIVLKRRR